jgi:aquaporin NIP
MRRYLAEGLGTFALVFAGTGSIIVNDVSHGAVTHVGVALTFGLVVMALIDTLGDVSGAHFNPAVTVGLWMARRFPARDVWPYMVSQGFGALLASGTLRLLFWDHTTLGATSPSGSAGQAFGLEILLTAGLMFVILNVSHDGRNNNTLAAVSIGAVIALEAMFAGPMTGASMNPARSLGPAVVSGQWSVLWIYLLAPLVGAALAVPGCRLVRENCCAGQPCCSLETPS